MQPTAHRRTPLKNLIVALLVLTLGTVTTFAGGNNAHYGNTGMVLTNIATSGGVVSNTSATWPRITSGFATGATNLPPSASWSRLRTRITNTNAIPILIFAAAGTNTAPSYYISATNTLDITFPIIDTTGEYYYGPASGTSGSITNTAPIVNESFGNIE